MKKKRSFDLFKSEVQLQNIYLLCKQPMNSNQFSKKVKKSNSITYRQLEKLRYENYLYKRNGLYVVNDVFYEEIKNKIKQIEQQKNYYQKFLI